METIIRNPKKLATGKLNPKPINPKPKTSHSWRPREAQVLRLCDDVEASPLGHSPAPLGFRSGV